MKKWMICAALGLAFTALQAVELFPDSKLMPIKQGDSITAQDTAGGYPIFAGEAKWTFVQGNVRSSSRGTPLGSVMMTHVDKGMMVLTQIIEVALDTNDGAFWTGTPCGPGHLVMLNKGRGREDHCMTIDASSIMIGSVPTTILNIKFTNTASASRMYNVTLQLNPGAFGWRNSGPGDWTPETLEAQPMRKEFIAKLTAWGEKFLDAGTKALNFSKPQDVYNEMPPVSTLLPTLEKYAKQKYGLTFMSMLEDLKHRPEPKAIAISHSGDFRTRAGSAWNSESQDEANKRALARCEENRPTSTPPCTLFVD
nr:hypothetical protein [uncultured Rhodoferax sp.]